ncbi:DNA translocase FtsK, partial [bacterium]|nr:DNA translocase FtsK [bacterium]
LFSFAQSAGPLGEWFLRLFLWIFGRGTYFLPLLLLFYALWLLRGESISLAKILGGLFLLFALSSLLSLFAIRAGLGTEAFPTSGGAVGYLFAFLFYKLFAFSFSLILFVLWFLAGVVLVAEVDWSKIWPKKEEKEEEKEAKRKKEAPVVTSSPFRKRALALFPLAKKEERAEEKEEEAGFEVADKDWSFPPLDLLDPEEKAPDAGAVEKRAEIIRKTLADYGIEVEMGEINVGPTVTQFTVKPKRGIKLSQISSRADEIAYALAAHPIRIEAPIPGKSAVGIEVPNQEQAIVRLRNLLASKVFAKEKSPLAFPLGKDVAGRPMVTELTRMPHLLVAGATGTGKSVFLHCMSISFLYRNSPRTLRLILVDPKRVEFILYNDIPHLLTPVVSDLDKAINAFRWATEEMDRRYVLLQEAGKRNLIEYNRSAKPEKRLPYIVIIIDELADLMAQARREVEASIVRLTQMARATGIHLVLATQRPSTDVITGLIKANITHRIAFQVASQIDSRTILDQAGAEKLLGRGDMLYLSADSPKPKRLQAPLVTEEEIKRVTNYLRDRQKAEYQEEILVPRSARGIVGGEDELLDQAAEIVIQERKASASLLQRRLRIGYTRAARLIDLLEEKGIVGPQEGSRPRQVLVDEETYQQMKEKGML